MELYQVSGRKNGEVLNRYAPTSKPEALEEDIERALAQ